MNNAAQKLGRKGGRATAARLTKDQRKESAQRAAKARWSTPMKQLVKVVARRATGASV